MSSLGSSGYGGGPSAAGPAGWTGGSYRRVRTKETARLVVTPEGVVANAAMANAAMANSSAQLPHGWEKRPPTAQQPMMAALLSAVLPPTPVALEADSSPSSHAGDGGTRRTSVSAPRRKGPATSMRARQQPSSTIVGADTDDMQARMEARDKARAAAAAKARERANRQQAKQRHDIMQAQLKEENAEAAMDAAKKKQQDTYFEWQQCLLDDIREAMGIDEENSLNLRDDHRPRYRELEEEGLLKVRTTATPDPEMWLGVILDRIHSGGYGVSPNVEGFDRFDNDFRVLLANTRCLVAADREDYNWAEDARRICANIRHRLDVIGKAHRKQYPQESPPLPPSELAELNAASPPWYDTLRLALDFVLGSGGGLREDRRDVYVNLKSRDKLGVPPKSKGNSAQKKKPNGVYGDCDETICADVILEGIRNKSFGVASNDDGIRRFASQISALLANERAVLDDAQNAAAATDDVSPECEPDRPLERDEIEGAARRLSKWRKSPSISASPEKAQKALKAMRAPRSNRRGSKSKTASPSSASDAATILSGQAHEAQWQTAGEDSSAAAHPSLAHPSLPNSASGAGPALPPSLLAAQPSSSFPPATREGGGGSVASGSNPLPANGASTNTPTAPASNTATRPSSTPANAASPTRTHEEIQAAQALFEILSSPRSTDESAGSKRTWENGEPALDAEGDDESKRARTC